MLSKAEWREAKLC